MPRSGRQLVTGLIVNGSKVRVPRELRRKVRAGLHNQKVSRVPFSEERKLELEGLAKFIEMVEGGEEI